MSATAEVKELRVLCNENKGNTAKARMEAHAASEAYKSLKAGDDAIRIAVGLMKRWHLQSKVVGQHVSRTINRATTVDVIPSQLTMRTLFLDVMSPAPFRNGRAWESPRIRVCTIILPTITTYSGPTNDGTIQPYQPEVSLDIGK